MSPASRSKPKSHRTGNNGGTNILDLMNLFLFLYF